jgi:hypothetical protein
MHMCTVLIWQLVSDCKLLKQNSAHIVTYFICLECEIWM